MAQFCHDQYDHPLLWCDQKRRAEERRIASESLAVAQQRKEEQDSYRTREIHEVSDADQKSRNKLFLTWANAIKAFFVKLLVALQTKIEFLIDFTAVYRNKYQSNHTLRLVRFQNVCAAILYRVFPCSLYFYVFLCMIQYCIVLVIVAHANTYSLPIRNRSTRSVWFCNIHISSKLIRICVCIPISLSQSFLIEHRNWVDSPSEPCAEQNNKNSNIPTIW